MATIDTEAILRDMEGFLNSEEGKKYLEALKKEEEEYCRNCRRRNAKFRSYGEEKRCEIIEWFINRYESDSYIQYETSKGNYEPSYDFYWFLLEYGKEYGSALLPCMADDDFVTEKYEIDKKYIVSRLDGQGSIVRVKRKVKGDIVIHATADKMTKIFYPDGRLLIETDNYRIFNDILVQIKEGSLEGFYCECDGQRINIDKYGTADRYPDGFFDEITNQLRKLVLG